MLAGDVDIFTVPGDVPLLIFPPMTNNGSGGSSFTRAGVTESFLTILIVFGCLIGWDETLFGGLTKPVVEMPLPDGFGKWKNSESSKKFEESFDDLLAGGAENIGD